MSVTQLPWEITDGIIDYLHSDLRTLGNCSTVCSDWLIRGRYHIFSTVQLWPWRLHGFLELAKSRFCTFTHHIRRVELDDSRVKDAPQESVLFNEAMAQSDLVCFSQVKSMLVENVDWTVLSPMQQWELRRRLAHFSKLGRLELQGVVFHDLREVIRVISSFPSLRQLSAHISFLKYLEYTVASASTLRLPSNLQTIELGTDDGLPVVLSCIAGGAGEPHLLALKLKNIKCSHLQYVSTALEKSGPTLQHISLGFTRENWQTMDPNDFVSAIDLSHLSQLRTLWLDGLRIQENKGLSVMGATLEPILRRIESSFLELIDLRFLLDADTVLTGFDWRSLERVLLTHHFFGLRLVRITIILEGASTLHRCESVEQWICRAMGELNSREVLAVRVICQ